MSQANAWNTTEDALVLIRRLAGDEYDESETDEERALVVSDIWVVAEIILNAILCNRTWKETEQSLAKVRERWME